MTTQTENTQNQAVASGNAYELIKKRLTEQGSRLETLTAQLNQTRLSEFGNSQMQVIARTRIRTENNCVARDMVQVGDYMLFGYNVFMGLKQETHISDVLSVYQITAPQNEGEDYQLSEVAISDIFLNQPNFVSDFNELYRYHNLPTLFHHLKK
ncbi:MAG: DNA repair ATPase [Moraxellaceae bacterium]|nr:DNA repair ATPase [Moraxellaceae bacterium]